MDLRWKLSATTLAEYRSPAGKRFADVVVEVNWRVFAGNGAVRVSDAGSILLPMPTDPKRYVALTTIREMDEPSRIQTILGWAEMVAPGFVNAQSAKMQDLLDVRRSAAKTSTVEIL